MISASNVQIAVDLEDAEAAQEILDFACPGVFDVTTSERAVWAYISDPTVPAVAVGMGRVEQDNYALLATLAIAAGVSHLAVGFWVGEEYVPAEPSGTLWEAMQIATVEEPI